jgi:hypothetical protein
VTQLIADPVTGLPPPLVSPEVERYSPALQLDFLGQPEVVIGADRWGAFGGGAMSFFFSDMLGDHSLAVAMQSNASFNGDFGFGDLGGGVMYRNLRRRWNWGVVVDQTPFRSGFAGSGVCRPWWKSR